jgi:hypothetical protein
VDLSELLAYLASYYSDVGRPSIGSRTDDAHADRRLLIRHSLGASAVRQGLLTWPTAGSAAWGSTAMSLTTRRSQEPPRPLPR